MTERSPDEVVVDLVFRWRDGAMPRRGEAAVLFDCRLHLCGANHLGQGFSVTMPVYFDGDPRDRDPPRFVLRKLGATVWKLAPSIAVPGVIHAFVTLVDVPEGWTPPAPK